MPPGDGKLKPEHEIILAVVLSIVAFAIISLTYYKIRKHTRALNAQQRQQDVERNGAGPPGLGGGGGGGGVGGFEKGLGVGERNTCGLGARDGGGISENNYRVARNLPPGVSVTSATDRRSRRSGGSGSDSGSDKGTPRFYVEHKVELEGDMKARDEIDGKGLSAAKDKSELEGSGPPVELPVEPMRFSWAAGLGTGTMESTATTGTFDSMTVTRSPSAVSDATTLLRYSHRPSYALRAPMNHSVVEEEEREKEWLASGGNTKITEMWHEGPPPAMRYPDAEVSPVSPAQRSVRTFSLDGTVVEAQLGGRDEWGREVAAAAPSSTHASAAVTSEQPISTIEPAVLRRDKWKVWRALAEEARRKH